MSSPHTPLWKNSKKNIDLAFEANSVSFSKIPPFLQILEHCVFPYSNWYQAFSNYLNGTSPRVSQNLGLKFKILFELNISFIQKVPMQADK